jgi:hypothetical protein
MPVATVRDAMFRNYRVVFLSDATATYDYPDRGFVKFRLALRQTEGLIGSIIRLLGLDLATPDHSTLSRRAERLEVADRRPVPSPCICWWTALG